MQKPQLVAVDTNIVMRLADGDEATIDSWHLIRDRLHPVQFIVPPTVLELPYNDAFVVSEAAVLDCILLVSRDSHLLDIDHEKLVLLFRRLDLTAPLIASPEKLLKKFSR